MFYGILILIALYIVPIWLAGRIGSRKGRRYAWLWGLFLGWVGVLIVALLGPPHDRELATLERDVRKAELERRKAELTG